MPIEEHHGRDPLILNYCEAKYRETGTVKVMHVTTAHSPDDVRIYMKECLTLSRAGFEVSLAAPGPIRKLPGVRHIPLPGGYNRQGRTKRLLAAWQVVRRERPMVLHVHDPELMLLAAWFARLGYPAVYDAHEYYVEALRERPWIPVWLRKGVSAGFAVSERFLAARIKHVVTADEGQNGRYRAYGCQTVTLGNVPVGELFQRYPPPASLPRRVFHVGSLGEARGESVILKAARILIPENVEFVLVGRSPSVNNLPPNVRVIGPVRPQEVPSILAQGGIGLSSLLPTQQYRVLSTLPTKVYEYMAAGLPIVLSNIPAHSRLSSELGFGRLYNGFSPDDCAEAIRSVFANPHQWLERAKQSREHFFKHWTWEQHSQRLLELYDRLLSTNRRFIQ